MDAQAEDGLGATRLGYSSLRFAARDPQPSGQHICPRRPTEQGGVAFGDHLPDQSAIQGRHLLVELLKPIEECLLVGASQCFQRKCGKFPVARFCGIERSDCGSPEIVEGFLCRFRLGLGFPDLVVDGR